MPTVNSLPGEGHLGDPVSTRIDRINAMLAALKNCFGRGVATILNTGTTVVVTHGLSFTPAAGDIVVTPLEDITGATYWWVHTFTATQFTIEVDAAVGQDTDFAWQAQQLD